MITHYCPACWQEIASSENRCPVCGFELAQDQVLSFEEKLLRSLEHPIPEKRYLAIQLLGELGSQAALPGLEQLLENEVNDIYVLREVLEALSKIDDPRSLNLLQKAKNHPYHLIRKLAEMLLRRRVISEKTLFILVRHGQTEWNRIERFRGRADVPLNATGLAQAQATGQCVAAKWRPVAVYSSPLSRAVKTAEAVAKHFDLAVQIHPGLADINYGAWQGLSPQEAGQRWPEMVAAWYNSPHLAHIPDGETLEDLRQRAMATVQELAARHSGETIVLVGHTVVNRIILLGVLGLGNARFWHIRQEPCAINIFETNQDDFVLVSLNDTCHLDSIPGD